MSWTEVAGTTRSSTPPISVKKSISPVTSILSACGSLPGMLLFWA